MTGDPDRFTVDPEPAGEGDTVEITYTNSALAGDDVTIRISNGAGENHFHLIELDSNGVGSTSFTIPTGWITVQINGPNSLQHSFPVQ